MQYRLASLTLALIFAVPGFALRPLTAQQSQVPGAIRIGITMVAVDVRVIDRYGRPVTDLKTIDTSRVQFTTVGGLRVATVQLALFAGDRRQEVVGELWQTLELKFTDQRFAEVFAEGYYAVRVSVTAAPRHVKAVV